MTTQKHRVQLDFAPQAFERLQEIKRLAELTSNAEAVRNALRLYEWFLRQVKLEGYDIQLARRGSDVVKEIEFVM
jgi:hypothetical protein